MKCLIVEDDEISSQVLEKMVSLHGSYDAVADTKKAGALFRQARESPSPYDLVLMDIMLPEGDGLKMVREIRTAEALLNIPKLHRVKVIMTTALDDPRTIMKALYESDADSYLIKPISLQRLEEEFRTLRLVP
jgi:two-component system chemotaxis response regulator CheY